MNKQDFINEFEKRCEVFRNSYKSINDSIRDERDELISFAKTAVMLDVVSQPEAQYLMGSLDQNSLQAA